MGRSTGSVLDNKETLMHFSRSGKGSNEAKNSFITSHYRYRNLALARKLEDSFYFDHHDINKTIRNLRFCSSMAIVEETLNHNASILKTSKSCKNPHCAICSRSKSNKITSRISKAIQDEKNQKLFHGKHFYFLTLTVKHNATTRNFIYLKEFNQYCQKLFRSKLWKTRVPYSTGNPLSGWLTAKECTFTPNGYHIHAHAIICTTPFKKKIKTIESEIRYQWHKITKDSTGVRLDLIRQQAKGQASGKTQSKSTLNLQAVKELVKYGTKTGKFEDWDGPQVDKYAEWIIATKGKNFVNASGFFRGMKLTGNKSPYDEKYKFSGLDPKNKYYIGKTTKAKFNYNHRRSYSSKFRKSILPKIYLESISNEFTEVTDIGSEMYSYLMCGLNEKEINQLLPQWIEKARTKKEEIKRELRKTRAKHPGSKVENENEVRQLELFKNEKPTNGTGLFVKNM